ncbi:hypothetical protein DdX_10910 [Ditylenchus destructor]|uniref:7TM GPCR serpentine receptor class x (Srx) domain-containing protein n=1 Tax=Ditylenchus destructor TaxID=166010 RepID=A0AAD4R4Y6_9BILA|nr:hypothetical protein DdX_10910 [Ditylenchus destructor]
MSLVWQIFVIHPIYWSNVCFRILFTNGVADCLQLGPMLIFSVLNILPMEIGLIPQRVGGAVTILGWTLVVMQHLLLALNRLIVIMRARFLGSKLVPNEDVEAFVFNIAHLFVRGLYFGMIALFLTPYMGALFHRGASMFVFDIQRPYTQTFRDINWYMTSCIPAMCFVIYIVIVSTTIMNRRILRRTGTRRVKNPMLNDRYEQRLLLQVIILYSLMSLLIIGWDAFKFCDPKGICHGKILGIVPVRLSRDWHNIAIQVPWMIYCGLNPFFFITMNKAFRKKYLSLYGLTSAADRLSQALTSSTFLSRCIIDNAGKAQSEQQQERYGPMGSRN